MKRLFPWLAIAGLCLSIGCDELREIDSAGDPSLVPKGGPEKLRLSVPDRPLSVFELVPWRLERVAHEGDDLEFMQARVLCAQIEMIGPGEIVMGTADDGSLETARVTRFELDRGQNQNGLFTATRSGSVVLQATLENVTCAGMGSVVADAQRVTLFFLNPDFEPPPEPPQDGGI